MGGTVNPRAAPRPPNSCSPKTPAPCLDFSLASRRTPIRAELVSESNLASRFLNLESSSRRIAFLNVRRSPSPKPTNIPNRNVRISFRIYLRTRIPTKENPTQYLPSCRGLETTRQTADRPAHFQSTTYLPCPPDTRGKSISLSQRSNREGKIILKPEERAS